MESAMMTRHDFFSVLGVEGTQNEYTPVSVGKKRHVGNTKDTFADYARTIQFTNPQELAQRHLENVHGERMFYVSEMGQPIEVKDRMLIVGDETGGQFAIHSNLYRIVQNNFVKDAFAQAMAQFGIDMIGNIREDKGRLTALAYYRNPECPSELGKDIAFGVRVLNSYEGSTKFGLSAFGVRKVCSNGMTLGKVIGEEFAKHLSTVEELVENFGHYLQDYMGKVDFLAGRFHDLSQKMLTIEEQDALLLGLGIPAANVDLMTYFRDQLNPEVEGQREISAYDLYNVATAYISHRTSGANSFTTTMGMMEKAEDILALKSLTRTINKGFEIRSRIIESGAMTVVSEA